MPEEWLREWETLEARLRMGDTEVAHFMYEYRGISGLTVHARVSTLAILSPVTEVAACGASSLYFFGLHVGHPHEWVWGICPGCWEIVRGEYA